MSDKTIRLKKTAFDIDAYTREHPIVSSLVTMGLLGAGTAGVASMFRDLNDALSEAEKAKKRKKPGVSGDTVVLRIPRSKVPVEEAVVKGAEIQDSTDKPVKVKTEGSDSSHLITIDTSKEGGPIERDSEGKFVPKFLNKGAMDKKALFQWTHHLVPWETPSERVAKGLPENPGSPTGVWTRYYEIMAGIGGGVGGYMLMDHIFRKAKQNRLKREIEAAQKQYMDMVDGSEVKNAELVNSMYMLKGHGSSDKLEKKAFRIPFFDAAIEFGKDLGAGSASAWTLSALASAYLTKKVMDRHFNEANQEEAPRKVTRVVFDVPKRKKPETEEEIPVEDAEIVKPAEAYPPRLKFMLKVSEDRKIEIQPEIALCLIQMMKEAMEAEAMVKSSGWIQRKAVDVASGWKDPDFGEFTTWASAQPGFHSWALDKWSGIPTTTLPNNISNSQFLLSAKGGALQAGQHYQDDPTKYFPNMKNAFMDNFRNDPEPWIKTLGDPKYAPFVNQMSTEGVANAFGKGGRFERLGRIPILGDLLQTIAGYFIRNTGWGKRFGLEHWLQNNAGFSAERAHSLTSPYEFNAAGAGWQEAPVANPKV